MELMMPAGHQPTGHPAKQAEQNGFCKAYQYALCEIRNAAPVRTKAKNSCDKWGHQGSYGPYSAPRHSPDLPRRFQSWVLNPHLPFIFPEDINLVSLWNRYTRGEEGTKPKP